MQVTNDQGELTWGNLVEILRNYEDYTSMSLPQFTKRTTIHSRTFIQREIAENDIIPDLMRTAMNMYAGFVISAFDMAKFVTRSHTVRDMMGMVSTESFHVDVEEKIMKELFPTMRINDFDVGNDYVNKISDTKSSSQNTSNSKVVDHNLQNTSVPSGRIIQIQFGDPRSNKDNRGQEAFTINMFLQLHPTVVPADVAEAFIDVNFTPTLKQRWLQMTTGEISFWKDLIFSHDLVKRRSKAMRQDKSGALHDMLSRQQSAVNKAWQKLLLIFQEKQNIANTILMFDKISFDRACVRNGLNFSRYESRQKFFNKTFSMMIFVVDQNYNKIDVYFHGLDIKAQYDFKQIKTAAKTDKFDLNDIMKSMSQGMAPRF